jgi:hypothetical protein
VVKRSTRGLSKREDHGWQCSYTADCSGSGLKPKPQAIGLDMPKMLLRMPASSIGPIGRDGF